MPSRLESCAGSEISAGTPLRNISAALMLIAAPAAAALNLCTTKFRAKTALSICGRERLR
jgi:hypothetical protein